MSVVALSSSRATAPVCGLLGEKLPHSYSPLIHRHFGDYAYHLFEIAPPQLGDFLTAGNYVGLNVTIPYKQAVIPFCDELSPAARAIGAVNTLLRRDGKLYGDNTDVSGFAQMLDDAKITLHGEKIILLGSGGTAKTAAYVLRERGAREIFCVARRGVINYENIYTQPAATAATIIVNTTPVGMYPHNEETPLRLENFPQGRGVVEVIYNPARTRLKMAAMARGWLVGDGLLMLVAQAARAAEIFTGQKISAAKIYAVRKIIAAQMQNIVLVGMPGCGKTTIGKMLAEKLSREFIDTDALIVARAGKNIPQIFAEDGEAVFRRYEQAVIAEVGKLSGKIIATGGGAILAEVNRLNLRQNATLIYLQRDLSVLDTAHRPLSANREGLAAIFAVREPLYREVADFTFTNHETPAAVVELIAKKIYA